MSLPGQHPSSRQLSAASQTTLREASLALSHARGFVYLPCLVDAEDTASLAYQQLQAALGRHATPLHWPRIPADASLEQQREALVSLNQALDQAIARLPDQSLIYLNASAWPDSPLLGAWPQYLNSRRESLRRKKHALILAWPQQQSEALMAGAPDLWSMRMLSPWLESVNTGPIDVGFQLADPSHSHTTSPAWHPSDEAAFLTLLRTHSLQAANLSWADALALLNQLQDPSQHPPQKALDLGLCLLNLLRQDTPEDIQAQVFFQLGNIYGELGLSEQELPYSQQAVTRYRHLAQTQPQAFEPYLAAGLNNLANILSALGQREQALQAAEEAAALSRRLAQAQPQAFEPQLAMSLSNLAGFLSYLGKREQALQAAEEAVTIRRRLAHAQPQAFEPDLAGSLNNLANILSDLGQREQALQASDDAVALYRRLAQAQPQAFEPDLAMSLNNLANRLSNLGQRSRALAAAQEAVALYEKWAARYPDSMASDLAMARRTLQNIQNPSTSEQESA